jgi:hypothetical protein
LHRGAIHYDIVRSDIERYLPLGASAMRRPEPGDWDPDQSLRLRRRLSALSPQQRQGLLGCFPIPSSPCFLQDQFALAVALILTIKLVKWADRWNR